jgi:hypothetical protein
VELNQEFLLETFFSYCKRPLHKKYQNVFNAECPICKEGKSAGRTRRLFFFPHKGYFFCHNCSKSWRPFEWVREVTTMSVPEIIKRNNEKSGEVSQSIIKLPEVIAEKDNLVIPDLPEGSVDLTDPVQIEFYKDNKYVKLALEYCISRRLMTATNSCNKFYVALEDIVHKNRLVIPFYGDNNKVICYQTRALTSKQFPKYLTKFGEKELFGLNNIDSAIPYVFVFEGPIDSMFVKNGVAMASLSPTEKQSQQLNNIIGFEQIYVFDNDKNNIQTAKKIEKYIKAGKKIFIWPKEFSKFKDYNEICCNLELDEIPWKFVVKNAASGPEALIKQKLFKSPLSCLS